MDEIKFRGKRRNNGEFVYGDLFQGQSHRKGQMFIHQHSDCCIVEVIPETVGQFVGRPDKNGKDIYAGDKIKQWDNVFVVKWRKERCGFWLYDGENPYLELSDYREQLEVIGTIYDTEATA